MRIFDRNNAAFQTAYGTKNPDGGVYDQVFENDIGHVGACITDATGQCTVGEEVIGDCLVIVKYVDQATSKTVYTGKPKSPSDFVDTNGDGLVGLATKDFRVIKTLREDGVVQFSGGSRTVVTGSYLEIIQPDFAVWENVADGYVYPSSSRPIPTGRSMCARKSPRGMQSCGLVGDVGCAGCACHPTFRSFRNQRPQPPPRARRLDGEMTTSSDAQRRLRRRCDSEQEDGGQELE